MLRLHCFLRIYVLKLFRDWRNYIITSLSKEFDADDDNDGESDESDANADNDNVNDTDRLRRLLR